MAPQWVEQFDWPVKKAFVALTRREIEASPEYDPAEPLGRDYEAALHRHYGKPSYWTTRDEPVTPLSGE